MSAERQKGTSLERQVADHIATHFPGTDRRPMSGTKDKGDINVPTAPFTVEVKNVAKLNLSGWIGEAEVEAANAGLPFGIVVHKRRGKGQPGAQYVTLTLDAFLGILAHYRPPF